MLGVCPGMSVRPVWESAQVPESAWEWGSSRCGSPPRDGSLPSASLPGDERPPGDGSPLVVGVRLVPGVRLVTGVRPGTGVRLVLGVYPVRKSARCGSPLVVGVHPCSPLDASQDPFCG